MLTDVMVLRVFQEVEFQVPAIEAAGFDRLTTEIQSLEVGGFVFSSKIEEWNTLWDTFHEKYDRYFVKEAD